MPNLEARRGCWWTTPASHSGAEPRGSRILRLGHLVSLQREGRTLPIPVSAYYPELGLSNGKSCPEILPPRAFAQILAQASRTGESARSGSRLQPLGTARNSPQPLSTTSNPPPLAPPDLPRGSLLPAETQTP